MGKALLLPCRTVLAAIALWVVAANASKHGGSSPPWVALLFLFAFFSERLGWSASLLTEAGTLSQLCGREAWRSWQDFPFKQERMAKALRAKCNAHTELKREAGLYMRPVCSANSKIGSGSGKQATKCKSSRYRIRTEKKKKQQDKDLSQRANNEHQQDVAKSKRREQNRTGETP